MRYATTVAQRDTASLLPVVLLDAAGTPVDLESSIVTFTQLTADGVPVLDEVPVEVWDGAPGLVGFPADTSQAGTFLIRWHAAFNFKRLSFPDQAPAVLTVVA